MFSKNNPVVLYLDRSGLNLYQGTLVNIVKYPFTQDIVMNLDVINKEQLFASISAFIDKNRIYPSIIILLLADAIVYEKDLSKVGQKSQSEIKSNSSTSSDPKISVFTDKEDQKIEIQNFLQKIPFEDILAKVIRTETLTRLVAVNKDLIFSTTEPFVRKGFLIEAIVPSFLYGQNVSFVNGLTPDIARLVLRKQELLKVANLLTDQAQINISPNSIKNEKESESEKKHKNLRPLILIGIFVALIIVLGIMLIGILNENKGMGNRLKNLPAKAKISNSPTPKAVESDLPIGSSSAILSSEDVRITIVQNSQSQIVFGLLKEKLESAGFKNIVSENSGGSVPAKSSALFSKDIPADIRQNAILEINKILPSVLILESENADSKITILIGQL